MDDRGSSKAIETGHTNDSSSDDTTCSCFDERANHQEATKRRPCSRKLSSMPGKKYLCQKNSADHNFSNESKDGGIGSMDSRDENHLESDDEINIHDIPCFCKGCSQKDEDELYYLQSTPQYLENGKAYDSDQMEWKFQSPCAISSWGHFCQSRRDYYKYRRSDYSSDSDDETVPRFNQIDPNSDGCEKPRSHLPVCDSLSDVPIVSKTVAKCSSKTDLLKNLSSRPQDGIKPNVFKEKFATILRWYSECSDDQKNTVLKGLLMYCDLPQMHLLSVKMGPNLHRGCPTNCQDILTWLPTSLAHKIMSYFDPVTLCRASQACCLWRQLGEEPSLWRKFCCQQKWRLSKAAEHKQVISHMSPEGSIMWKKVFAERYRLRQNWLNGRCTVRTFEGHSQGISCVQFDDTRIVSGSSDKTIKVWNIRTNAPWSVQTLVGHSGTVRCLHLEGKRLVSGSTDKSIKVWDLSTQESWSSIACKVTMVGHEDTVRCIQVDDDKVISGSYDFTIKVWDTKTGNCRMTLRGHQAAVLCVQFNDTKIVSGSCDKTIKIWSYEGTCIRTLTGHQDAVTCLQFDSTRIVSGSMDCNLKMWDIHSGDCINTIDWKASEGHTGVVRCLQADSWRLCSAADDKTIKVWNLQTGERLVTLRNHTDGVTCLQFNDFIIVSGSYDKTVKLWDFSCC